MHSKHIDANMGQAYLLNTESLKVAAAAHQDKTKNDFLNKWNPEADFSLKNAEIQVDGISETIYVPNIDFLFNSLIANRYLENKIRDAYDFSGTSVKFVFREKGESEE